jgi:NAD(P)-dependent dehydrogenase (short-subunit alcohol dehydrogenase family)
MRSSWSVGIVAKLLCACVAAGLTGLAQADTVLITGANSGIGLEFAKQYAAKGWTVIATHRRDETPSTLKDLEARYPNVRAERMDVTKRNEIHALVVKLKGAPIDVLINNAGVVILGGQDGAWRGPGADVQGQNFGTLNYDEFDIFMKTNVAGPSMVTEEFYQNVKASKQKKVIAISSSNGMITGKPLCCGLFWYRLSKAALNKLMISIAATVRKDGVTVVMFNPGAVRVEKQANVEFPGMLPTPVVVTDMIRVIDRLTIADSARFLQHDGTTQPW